MAPAVDLVDAEAAGPAPKNRIADADEQADVAVRVVKNAFRAASEFFFSSHQCPISMNEQRPMISQPRSSWMVFSATPG